MCLIVDLRIRFSVFQMSSHNLFRFNVVDARGVASFVGPAHALKIIAAACSRGADNVHTLLDIAVDYDADWATAVKSGLYVFDEHNITELSEPYKRVGLPDDELALHPFRVLNAETRRRSMEPARLGLVVINLNERRIIQVQNSYANLMRTDRGRIRRKGRPTQHVYAYDLPDAWNILP
ncbi:MAG: hypothetical protein ACR2OE_11965 [Thermomicrobiales bacterium]